MNQSTPVLYVLGTPIGNLSDMTFRGVETLQKVDWVLSEDTRVSKKLLQHFEIPSKRMSRLDAHTKNAEIQKICDEIIEKKLAVALVSDAGTPGVSDPGAALVSECRERKIQVVPIPGVSALTSLLSVSGQLSNSVTFYGFFPRTSKDQNQLLSEWNSESAFFFESPKRIKKTLEFLVKWEEEHQEKFQILLGKEMTKVFESFFHGNLTEVQDQLQELPELGEWSFILSRTSKKPEEKSSDDWEKTLRCFIAAEVSPKVSSRVISQEFGVPKNRVYETALELSLKKKSSGS